MSPTPIATGKPGEEILARIDRLVEFLEGHFLSEQIAMHKWAYPDHEAHVREHDQAVGLLRDLRSRMDADDPDGPGRSSGDSADGSSATCGAPTQIGCGSWGRNPPLRLTAFSALESRRFFAA
jgi:hypothetical protein